jgi:FPC/CPF motif-containing protein YcgG
MTNPYKGNSTAVSNSCYLKPNPASPNQLVEAFSGKRTTQRLALHVHGLFRGMLTNPAFPCILGRSAFNNFAYRFGLYSSIQSRDAILGVCHDLCEFVDEQDSISQDFSTFVTCFRDPNPKDESDFEGLLWEFLQMLHDEDSQHSGWDPTTSSDPDHHNYSFSFAGRSYFVIGMHGLSSRFSRKFSYPAVVFNAHKQFEKLRADGTFAKIQSTIRNNDVQLQGQINPSLKNFGQDSEAKQYSGRLVETNWKCPFRA